MSGSISGFRRFVRALCNSGRTVGPNGGASITALRPEFLKRHFGKGALGRSVSK